MQVADVLGLPGLTVGQFDTIAQNVWRMGKLYRDVDGAFVSVVEVMAASGKAKYLQVVATADGKFITMHPRDTLRKSLKETTETRPC
jgi:hypothetical protein